MDILLHGEFRAFYNERLKPSQKIKLKKKKKIPNFLKNNISTNSKGQHFLQTIKPLNPVNCLILSRQTF